MSISVSVVVPSYNPGGNIADCLASLQTQTMSRERYEVIVVDDGSTDGTAELLDGLAAADPEFIRVIHIDHSGAPSRPRNVGIHAARGDYVQLVDSDDTLGPAALERLHEVAVSSAADMVIGKLASDFRVVDHGPFRRTVTGLTLDSFALADTSMTPHRMFRRDFVLDHDLSFPEIRHLEDTVFCMHASVHARSVAIVGDVVCTFYRRRRGFGINRADHAADPIDYYRNLSTVFDLIDRHVTDDERRARVYERFYRVEMLGRLREQPMLDYSPEYRRRTYDEVRRLADSRVPPGVQAHLALLTRVQSRVLLDADVGAMLTFAAATRSWRADVRADARWVGGRLRLDVEATVCAGDDPVHLERDPVSGGWVLPQAYAPTVTTRDRLLTADDLARSEVDVILVSRSDSSAWFVPGDLRLSVDAVGRLVAVGSAEIDPRAAIADKPLPAGLWDVRLRVAFGGIRRTAAVKGMPGSPPSFATCLYADEPRSVLPYWTNPNATLALDADEWMHPLQQSRAEPPTVKGRALRMPLPEIVAAEPLRRTAHIAVDDSAGAPPRQLPATLRAGPEGAELTARLLHGRRRGSAGDGPVIRWRAGGPGGAPPAQIRRWM